jgi:hypothetical protein
MGVDFEKIKKKAAEEKLRAAKRNFTKANFWTPKDGSNEIRLLPPWTNDPDNENCGLFWREIYVHFGVGADGENKGRIFSCPQRSPDGPKTSCPICAHVESLYATQDPVDAEVAKDIRAKQRLYSNIIDLSDPVYVKKDLEQWEQAPRYRYLPTDQ